MNVLRRAPRRPLLSREDEAELSQQILDGREASARIEAGDSVPGDRALVQRGEAARRCFVESNIGLAVSMANKMPIPPHVDRDDVVQDGILGIERALDDFDHTRGWKFSTYASWWIRRSMQQGLEHLVAPVRIPTHRTQELQQARRLADVATDGGDATVHLTPGQVQAQQMSHMISLDQPAADDATHSIGDLVPSTLRAPDLEVESELDRAIISQLLDELDLENAEIVRARYGLDGSEPVSLVDLANERGVTPEAIRRRIVRSLARMRPEAERLAAASAA